MLRVCLEVLGECQGGLSSSKCKCMLAKGKGPNCSIGRESQKENDSL